MQRLPTLPAHKIPASLIFQRAGITCWEQAPCINLRKLYDVLATWMGTWEQLIRRVKGWVDWEVIFLTSSTQQKMWSKSFHRASLKVFKEGISSYWPQVLPGYSIDNGSTSALHSLKSTNNVGSCCSYIAKLRGCPQLLDILHRAHQCHVEHAAYHTWLNCRFQHNSRLSGL